MADEVVAVDAGQQELDPRSTRWPVAQLTGEGPRARLPAARASSAEGGSAAPLSFPAVVRRRCLPACVRVREDMREEDMREDMQFLYTIYVSLSNINYTFQVPGFGCKFQNTMEGEQGMLSRRQHPSTVDGQLRCHFPSRGKALL